MRTYIVDRYIVREIFVPFGVSLFVFTGVLFLARSLKLVELVINKSVPLGDIALLFSYLIPRFLEIAIPMSLLISIILAFGRLSSDSELVVMRSFGLNLRRLSLPVILFSTCCLLVTLFVGFWLRPWANYQLGVGMFEIAKLQASSGLTQGIFNDLGQLTIYAETISRSGKKMENVIIADRRNPEGRRTFVAKHGQLISNDQERTLTMRLYNGSIHEGSGMNYGVTLFDINNINIEQEDLIKKQEESGKDDDEMYITELLSNISKLEKESLPLDEKTYLRILRYKVEFHKRLVVPAACLCIALIAMALGVQPSRGGHSWGPTISILAGIIVILLFYLLLALAKVLGEQALLSPGMAMWTPNVVFFSIAFLLFKRMGSERWLAVSEAFGDTISKVLIKLKLKENA